MSVKAWAEDRPERQVLLYLLALGAALSLLFALLPRGVVESALGVVMPRTLAGGGARDAILGRHRVFFGGGGVFVCAMTLALPWTAQVMDRALRQLARPDRKAFLLAVVALIVVSRGLSVGRMLPIVPGEDSGHYHQIANTLLDEGRFIEYASHPDEPDGFRAWRLPGYPVALAGALAISGRDDRSVVALNILWMIVLVLAAYALVRALAGERAARLAALGCAIYPRLLTASLAAMSELQFGTLLVVSAAILVVGRGSMKHSVLAGAALGLAALTRGNALLMLLAIAPAYAGVLWWTSTERDTQALKRGLTQATVFGLAFVLTISPWTIRNRLVLDAWVPLASNGGWNMWLGHRPDGDGRITDIRREREPAVLPLSANAGEVERSTVGMRESLKYWKAEPVRNLRISARIVSVILKVDSGALSILRTESRAEYYAYLALFNAVYYGMWLLFAVWAIGTLLGRWPPEYRAGPAFLMGLLYVATYIPFIAYGRYKVPAIPFLIAGASIVLVALVTQSGERAAAAGRTA